MDGYLKDHDTRLINKVLEEVKREVASYVKGLDSLPWDEQVDEDISTILDSLKVK